MVSNARIKIFEAKDENTRKKCQKVGDLLEEHPKVIEVYYPGLESHPQHELARKQMKGFGGMLSFDIEGGINEAKKFVENLDIFHLAESLGGVESLAEIPAVMTHASLSEEERREVGITGTLIRLSVGIEEFNDLKNDLEKSFEMI